MNIQYRDYYSYNHHLAADQTNILESAGIKFGLFYLIQYQDMGHVTETTLA